MASIRLFDLQTSNTFTDVTFNVQGCDIRAHRLVVLSVGGVLSTLLQENPGEAKVEIKEEVALETFKSVLEYVLCISA